MPVIIVNNIELVVNQSNDIPVKIYSRKSSDKKLVIKSSAVPL